jgi:hypothetical protein
LAEDTINDDEIPKERDCRSGPDRQLLVCECNPILREAGVCENRGGNYSQRTSRWSRFLEKQADRPSLISRRQWTIGVRQTNCSGRVDKLSAKQLLRTLAGEVKLMPEDLEVNISYRLPEAIMNGMVAGDGFEPPTFGL